MKKRDLLVGLGLCVMLLSACNEKQEVVYPESQTYVEETTSYDEESWEAWQNKQEQLFLEDLMSVSLDDLTETEIRAYKGDWYNENIKYPIIAELPEENIYLYGYNGEYKNYRGVVLRIGDWFQAFDWDYITGRSNLPELYIYDLDGDGEREIICVTHSGAGTGISIDILHVLKKNRDGNYEDHVFIAEDYEQQLQEAITFEYDKDLGVLNFRTADVRGSEVYHAKSDTSRTPDAVTYDNIIYFYFEEDTLKLHSAPRLLGEGLLPSEFPILGVRADIKYRNSSFTLENISFTEEAYSLLSY